MERAALPHVGWKPVAQCEAEAEGEKETQGEKPWFPDLADRFVVHRKGGSRVNISRVRK
jgi:hypothetical protein